MSFSFSIVAELISVRHLEVGLKKSSAPVGQSARIWRAVVEKVHQRALDLFNLN